MANCPRCRSEQIHRSRRKGIIERRILAMLFVPAVSVRELRLAVLPLVHQCESESTDRGNSNGKSSRPIERMTPTHPQDALVSAVYPTTCATRNRRFGEVSLHDYAHQDAVRQLWEFDQERRRQSGADGRLS